MMKTAAPVNPQSRLEFVDILRGFALLGVLIANMASFSGYSTNPANYSDFLDVAVLVAIQFFVRAKFYSLFSFLFGWGFAVQMRRAAQNEHRFQLVFVRRMVILLIFGLMHGMLIWSGDILSIYAIFGLGLLLFRNRSERTLLITAVSLLIFTIILNLPGDIMTAFRIWYAELTEFMRWGTLPDTILATGTLLQIITKTTQDFWAVRSSFIYTIGPIFSMFLLGLYVGKRQLFQNVDDHPVLLRRTLIIGLLIGVIFNGIFVWNTRHPEWVAPEYHQIVRVTSRTIGAPALMLFYVSGLVLLMRRDVWLDRLRPLGNVGRMALSNYLLQSVVCVLIFYGYGLGLYGKTDPSFGLIVTGLLFMAQIRFSAWHLNKYQFGPMEWLWRTLTYGRRQPWSYQDTYENMALDWSNLGNWFNLRPLSIGVTAILLLSVALFFHYRSNFDSDTMAASSAAVREKAMPAPTRLPAIKEEKQESTIIVTPSVRPAVYNPRSIVQSGDVMALAQAFDPVQALSQIEVLSGEPYNGRLAASVGGLAAGDYLAEQFASFGLQPAGDDGTFFQTFPISYTNLSDVPQFTLTQADGTVKDSYRLHQDYAPIVREFVGDGSGAGDVVWLNQCRFDDFGKVTAAGKVVLCQPEPGYEAFVMAHRAAVEYGAEGLLLVTDPTQRPADMGDRFTNPWIPEPIPALRVYPEMVDDLFIGSGTTFTETLDSAEPRPLTTHVALSVETLGYSACPVEQPLSGCSARNVLAVLPGRDPEFADELVIIGAHYDHLGNGPSETGPQTVWAGANDDASGTAVLLEIARLWHEQGYVPRRTVLFAAWDAEELGLLGSTYYVQNPQYPHENVVAKLQLDMVGAGGDFLNVDGSSDLAGALQTGGEKLGIAMAQSNLGRSDHVPFLQAGVPAALLIWLDENGGLPIEHYHRPADTPDVIDLDKLEAAGELTALTVLNLVESQPAILSLLADRETAVTNNDLNAFLSTSEASQTAVDTAWFNDLQAYNPLTVILSIDNLQMNGTTATGDTTIQVTYPVSYELEAVTGHLPTQFRLTETGWRWQGPYLAQTSADDVIVRYPADVEDDLSALPTAVRSQYTNIADTLNLPADTPFTLQLFPDKEALRTATALFMPRDQQSWAGPGLLQLVYSPHITETTVPVLTQLALANNGFTARNAPWLWHGLPAALRAKTDSIAVQAEMLPLLYDGLVNDKPLPQDAAAWAATDYALRQVGWDGLLAWQETDAWQQDWRQRLTAVQADLDLLLEHRTAAVLSQNEADFLQTAVHELAVAQRRWLADLDAHPLNSFVQSAVPLAFLDDGSVLAQVTMNYELAGQGPSTADMVIRFVPGEPGLLWAGKYLQKLEGETAVIAYPEGHQETAVAIQEKVSQWTPELAALLNISPTLPIQIELYDAPDDLRAAIALPYHATNWTEPGQAIKLQVDADDGVLITQLTRQLLHQAGVVDEWMLRGVPALLSARFDGGLARYQLLAQWPLLKTAVAENKLLDLAVIAPAVDMPAQESRLSDLQAWDAAAYFVQTEGWVMLLTHLMGDESIDINTFEQRWALSLAQDHIQPEWVEMVTEFDAEAAMAHIEYLASEPLAGRLAGTVGAEMAAEAVAEVYREAGLQPAGDNGSYFQSVPITVSQTISPLRFEMEMPAGETSAQGLAETAVFIYRDEFLPISPIVGGEPVSGELYYMNKGAEYGDIDFGGGIVVRNPAGTVADEISQAVAHNAGALLLTSIKNDEVDLYNKTPDTILPTSEIPVLELTLAGESRLLDFFNHDRRSIKKLGPIQPLETTALVQFSTTSAQQTTTANVLGIWPGSDPLLSQEVVIIGAHTDYVGDDDGGRRYSGRNAASGAATMLEILKLWQSTGYQPKRTVLFAAWGAQELGNLGSDYYAANPTLHLSDTIALIQLDSVGGGGGFALGAEGDEELDSRLMMGIETAVTLLDEKVLPTSPTTQSDHLAFVDASFPTMLISWRLAGNENLSDEVDHTIKLQNLRVSGQSAALLLMSLAQ